MSMLGASIALLLMHPMFLQINKAANNANTVKIAGARSSRCLCFLKPVKVSGWQSHSAQVPAL